MKGSIFVSFARGGSDMEILSILALKIAPSAKILN